MPRDERLPAAFAVTRAFHGRTGTMRWEEGRESENVEDRRGFGGGGFGISPGIAGGGIGAVAIVVIGLLLGVDPGFLLQLVGGGGGVAPPPASQTHRPAGGEDEMRRFVSVVLADTEDTWTEVFRRMGGRYEEPKLVLFSGATQSACGYAQAAVGPFYCPGDHKVYLDLSFFRDLRTKYGAPGDFAEAYVIAHEVGHHVQTLLGITRRVDALRQRGGGAQANGLSVRLELQADCFAGVWANQANRARHILEAGDVDEGLQAASAVGDDRLQMRARGYVVPESFTHGSSAQRARWFRRGLDQGTIGACDTFNADRL
jgi:predicted metalloprotease